MVQHRARVVVNTIGGLAAVPVGEIVDEAKVTR